MTPVGPNALVTLAAGAMQLCWIRVGLDLLARKGWGTRWALAEIALLFLFAFVSNRLAKGRTFSRLLLFPVNLLAWAAAALLLLKLAVFPAYGLADPGSVGIGWREIFGSLNPATLAAGSSLLIWVLGARLAFIRPSFPALFSEFQFGLVVFFVLSLLDMQVKARSSVLLPAMLAFFFSALAGISLAHVAGKNGWLSGPQRTSWSVFLLGAILLILALGFLLSLIVSPSLVSFILALLARAGAFILEALNAFFHFLGGFFPPTSMAPLPVNPAPGGRSPVDPPFVFFSDETRAIIRIIWGGGCLTLLLIALWRVSSQIYGWLRNKRAASPDTEIEPLRGAFRADLRRLLRRILLLFRLQWLFGKSARRADPAEAESVRQVYRQLLRWAAARGCPRRTAQTPYEFLRVLAARAPEARGELTGITQTYVEVRYGPSGPGAETLQRLLGSWRKVKQIRWPRPPGKKNGKGVPRNEQGSDRGRDGR